MKYLLVQCLFIIGISKSYSQLNGVDILVAKNSERITSYLDSLNHLKSNPYYKIEKDVSPEGSLILKSEYAISDQEFYKCLSVSFLFKRIKGEEFCIRQLVMGYTRYADTYLNYLKDNFTTITPGTWQYVYPSGELKVVAEFVKKDDGFFYITYDLQTVKNEK